jgi:DNA modification methylase
VTPFVRDPDFTLYVGDVRQSLAEIADESVDCIVTSPPYLGLRDYGIDGQIGHETTIAEYVATLVSVFAAARRVLTEAGTLWLNLGDSYNAYNGGAGPSSALSQGQSLARPRLSTGYGLQQKELKPKDLMMVPARVGIALCDDGWYLRSEILWCKPNGMVESIGDRPTRSSERIYLLSKSRRYYFGQDDLRQPFADGTADGYRYAFGGPKAEEAVEQGLRTRPVGSRTLPGLPAEKPRGADGRLKTTRVEEGSAHEDYQNAYGRERWPNEGGANIRDWWVVPVEAVADVPHHAIMPREIARRCILGGCPPGGTVLDPFLGSGTTALVARGLGRKAIGIELSPEHAQTSAKRLQQLSLLAESAA